jgi:hypothetical protein
MATNKNERFIYTTRYVLDSNAAVTVVLHDWNDEWHFWSDEGEVDAEARVVLFGEIIATDKGLEEIANIPMGTKASRKDPHDKWKIITIKKEAEDNR